jgi:hypothetical protein
VDNAAVKPQYEQCLDGLAAQLEAWAASPTTEATQRIAEDLAWLETRRQAPELVAEVRALFTASNFQFEVNGQIVDLGVAGPVDEVAPIDDCILGTTIHGVGHTVGHSNARLAADPALGAFDVLLQAVNCSRNTGYHRPVCIQSSGTSTLSACKRFWIDSQGLHALPSVACVQVSSCISDIRATNGKQFIERIAWRKALKQEPQADAIAASHGECRLNERVDAQAVTTLDRANADYETKVHKPLSERRAFPRQIAFSTTAEVIRVSGMVAAAGQLAAPTAAPPLAGPAEISLRIHESSINNMAATVLTGMRLSDEMLQRTAKDLLGTVPERLKPDQNQDPFTIVFPKEQPITVSLADNGLTVTLRGQEYLVGERTRRSATNVMASYKFVKTEQGFKAVRQGELQFFAPGKRPGSPRGAGQQAEWMALQRKFGKIFAPEILFKGFTPEGKLAAAGKFVPVEVSARDGWLIVGWSRATPAKGS